MTLDVTTAAVPGSRGWRRLLHPVQKSVVNPLVRLAFRLGIPDPGDALLETTGRRTGRRRITPVCDGLEGDSFWLLSQRGRRADWVLNIDADPHVRVKVRRGIRRHWLAGTAHILDDDDTQMRWRILNQGSFARRLCLSASGSMASDLVTIRIDLDSE
jgi:deazaflavin-dependent oxidoreductase (nitroreductase family)